MKKIYAIAAGAALLVLPSCIQEFEPQSSVVSGEQAASAPGAFENFLNGIPSSVCGQFTFSGSAYQKPNDFGYPSLILMRDVMGNDIVAGTDNNWFGSWYESDVTLAPIYLNCQYPWTYYYTQIKNCNTVIDLAADNMLEYMKPGLGIALTMRTLYYLELAQMYAPKAYGQDKNALTVPIVDNISIEQARNNPRVTWEAMMSKLLGDLNQAEEYLQGYQRDSKEIPDISIVNGLRARIYLLMEDWPNAEKYAKLAQDGYTPMTAAEYTDRNNGFNDAYVNDAWMLCCSFKAEDACMVVQTGNHSWGSWMICELPPNSYGYYTTYGQCNFIDRHLYESMPATDARKKCYIDFALDELSPATQRLKLSAYTDVPQNVLGTSQNMASSAGVESMLGGMPLKFRAKGGNHTVNKEAWLVDVPMMRVEEMILIEAEAVGRQPGGEARGRQLLEAFAKTRDPQYVYGTHQDAYYNTSTPAFVNEVWWQRRVEFWGEGLATFDIKRLGKGIIRSYAGTNHLDGYQWNVDTTPQWMTFCIVQTETNNNSACVNNPTPIAPTGNSPEFQW